MERSEEMTNINNKNKEILQALYALCEYAWSQFKKRLNGGTIHTKYTAKEVDKIFKKNLRNVFGYNVTSIVNVGTFSCTMCTSDVFKMAATFETLTKTKTKDRMTFEF